jgi:hypothetical protein
MVTTTATRQNPTTETPTMSIGLRTVDIPNTSLAASAAENGSSTSEDIFCWNEELGIFLFFHFYFLNLERNAAC